MKDKTVDIAFEDYVALLRADLSIRQSESDWVTEQIKSEDDISIPKKFAAALCDKNVRDTLLWDLTNSATLPIEKMEKVYQAIETSDVPKSGLLTSIGIAHWLNGDLVGADIRINTALKEDSDYALAVMVNKALEVGLDVQFWADTVNTLTRDECIVGAE